MNLCLSVSMCLYLCISLFCYYGGRSEQFKKWFKSRLFIQRRLLIFIWIRIQIKSTDWRHFSLCMEKFLLSIFWFIFHGNYSLSRIDQRQKCQLVHRWNCLKCLILTENGKNILENGIARNKSALNSLCYPLFW